jgi:hypothetical protein
VFAINYSLFWWSVRPHIRLLALFVILTHLCSCHQAAPRDIIELGAYLENPDNGLVLKQDKEALSFTLKYLPESYLRALDPATLTPPAQAVSAAPMVAVFKLRLQGRDSRASLPALFQQASTPLSADEQQNQLFYHMAEAAHLQLGNQQLRPLAAHVEMSPHREQYVDIVFTFSVDKSAMRDASEAVFVLDRAFFLTEPVRFVFATENILAIAS